MNEPSYQLRQALVEQLESLRRSGVMQLPKPKSRPKKSSGKPATANLAPASQQPAKAARAAASVSVPTPATAPVAKAKRPTGAKSTAAAAQELEILREEVAGCTKCKELARTRTQTVFGVGNSRPRLCFLGEAPGADEDKQGEPFVGRAGQLLNKILEACKLRREDVYILNVLKCRPPGNRPPLPEEACNCRGFLERQFELLQPEFICCLGASAAHTLLESDVPIGKMRGKFYEAHGARVLCTYHPAYLLRNPDVKKLAWEDMKLLMREMGTPVD